MQQLVAGDPPTRAILPSFPPRPAALMLIHCTQRDILRQVNISPFELEQKINRRAIEHGA
jgi:hypothetical protein